MLSLEIKSHSKCIRSQARRRLGRRRCEPAGVEHGKGGAGSEVTGPCHLLPGDALPGSGDTPARPGPCSGGSAVGRGVGRATAGDEVWATGTRWQPVRGLPPGSVGDQVGGPRPSSHAHPQSTLSLHPGSPVAAHSPHAGAGERGVPQTWARGSGREEGPLGVGDRGAVMTR